MNRFSVDSSDTASDQLADAWNRHPADANAITKAQHAIEQILANDPLGKGQEVSEGLRKITVSPLTNYYSVNPAERTVEIEAIDYTP